MLSLRQPDGSTLREHLTSIARQTGIVPPELEPVDCPHEVKYIWGYWLSMNQRRHTGEPISNMELQAWASLRGLVLEPFEMDMLDRIEGIYFKQLHELKARSTK